MKEDMNLSYRSSSIENNQIVLKATFKINE